MGGLSLEVSVPVCSFRRPYAREFLETEQVPPPSTVYGFLLSLVGETNRGKYVGTRLAIAIINKPAISLVLRTSWRIKKKDAPPGVGSNKRPDYQEVLTGLVFGVCVDEGPLADRIISGIAPVGGSGYRGINRFGGLCLGESHDLVDTVTLRDFSYDLSLEWLVQDDCGNFSLPVWADHVGSKGTRWGQFKLEKAMTGWPQPMDPRWVLIKPPE